MKRERVVAFVVARLGSERLTEKHLRPIGGRLLLDRVVDRLEECPSLDEIVLTTVSDPENERLVDYAERRGIGCYLYDGDVENVTNRLRRAAEEANADVCVLASADCPLIHPPAVERLVAELLAHPEADIAAPEAPPVGRKSLVQGIAVARRRCWQLADDLSDTPELRAHQFPVIKQREPLFDIVHFDPPEDFHGPELRLSVDTWADLELMEELHRRLSADGRELRLPDAVRLLEQHPELREINAHVRQRATEDRALRVLLAVDAVGDHGHANLDRSLELALQIVERTSRPVTFLVDDVEAVRRVESRGLRAVWGAVGRSAREAAGSCDDDFPHHDLLVLDAAPGRELPTGWRARFASPVVVLDALDPWTREADAVLRCGLDVPPDATASGQVVLGGQAHAIVPRERARPQVVDGTSRVVEDLFRILDSAGPSSLPRAS